MCNYAYLVVLVVTMKGKYNILFAMLYSTCFIYTYNISALYFFSYCVSVAFWA